MPVDPIHLSFTIHPTSGAVVIAFDKQGGELLIARVKQVLESKGHSHDFVGSILTETRHWAAKDAEPLDVQYEFSEPEDWDLGKKPK